MTSQTVREIGEFGLIAALRGALPESVAGGANLPVGIGDDAAVWQPDPGESLVITTDSLIEGVHFRLDWTSWRQLGHKSLAVNLSDLAAMGAAPRLVTLSLGLRGTEPVDGLVEMYTALGALAAHYGVIVAGGDIVASPDALGIHITAIGVTRDGRYLTRSGAKCGDLIAVSGTLGASAAGYRLLNDGGAKSNAATAELLIAAHLEPLPRVELGAHLLHAGASACMDLSDGLFGDLPKILQVSGVGATVEHDAVPVAAAVRALFPNRWFELATRGGEDYELLFTCPPERFAAIQAGAAEVGSTVTAIGQIEPVGAQPGLRLRRSDGSVEEVRAGAFDHFSGG